VKPTSAQKNQSGDHVPHSLAIRCYGCGATARLQRIVIEDFATYEGECGQCPIRFVLTVHDKRGMEATA
jgi:hypothetical protein